MPGAIQTSQPYRFNTGTGEHPRIRAMLPPASSPDHGLIVHGAFCMVFKESVPDYD